MNITNKLRNKLQQTETGPDDWKEGLFIKIPNKGD